jgi:hypothetical protein
MGRSECLTHPLFVVDVLILCYCLEASGMVLKDILELFCDATCMVIFQNWRMVFGKI